MRVERGARRGVPATGLCAREVRAGALRRARCPVPRCPGLKPRLLSRLRAACAVATRLAGARLMGLSPPSSPRATPDSSPAATLMRPPPSTPPSRHPSPCNPWTTGGLEGAPSPLPHHFTTPTPPLHHPFRSVVPSSRDRRATLNPATPGALAWHQPPRAARGRGPRGGRARAAARRAGAAPATGRRAVAAAAPAGLPRLMRPGSQWRSRRRPSARRGVSRGGAAAPAAARPSRRPTIAWILSPSQSARHRGAWSTHY
jgi:hypothetical protein